MGGRATSADPLLIAGRRLLETRQQWGQGCESSVPRDMLLPQRGSPTAWPGTHGIQHKHRRLALRGHEDAEESFVALRVVIQVDVADAPCRRTWPVTLR